MAGRWEWLTQVYQPPFSFLAVGTGLLGTLALAGARGRRFCVEYPLRLKNMSVLVCVLLPTVHAGEHRSEGHSVTACV